MTLHLGDVPASSTLYIPFTTYDANGASVTMTGLATSDILIYKNGSTTQRSSTSGFTLLDTDGIDFDSVTGLHGFSVDLSDNADAGFYAAGAQYWVVVSTVTVSSQTITLLAATFRIRLADNTAGLMPVDVTRWNNLVTVALPLIPTVAGRTLDCSAGGEAGVDWANVGTPGSTVNLSATTVNLTNTLTTYTGNTVQTGDSFARIGAAGVSLSAIPDLAGVTTLLSRLSATRAGYLDNLSAGTVPTAAQNATAVFTTAMTESYSSLAGTKTLAQALYEIAQWTQNRSVSGTTETVKKVDGSSSALTLTLDSSTAPTSTVRAS